MADRIDRISWTGWVACSFLGAGGGLAASLGWWYAVAGVLAALLVVLVVANWLIRREGRPRYAPDFWRVTVGK